ncbi:MAG TPA: nitrite reductase small subunit NirD [Candidatus Limnocylindrales bacterium]|nr:nitrite reductase small subunit NirD [Candidatus Limnocylindrales bacterium]
MSATGKRWFQVTHCENIPVREGRRVEIASRQIAIFNLGDRFLAVENPCPHRGGPLADGIVSGTTVVCPLHAWKFDLIQGNAVNHPESSQCLVTFPVCVEQGIVSIEIPVAAETEEPSPSVCEHRDRPLRWVQRKPLSPYNAVQRPVDSPDSVTS